MFYKTSEEDTTKMRHHLAKLCLVALVGVFAASMAQAQVMVMADINASTTWTANNEYILTDVIYVTNGATLTIEPGTVVRGENEDAPGTNNPGTLVITRGSKINAQGTMEAPIVFTDLNDDNIGGAQGTPPYDSALNSIGLSGQWGGLIMLGRTYVARGTAAGPDANVENQIEGLVNDPRGLYGDCLGGGLMASECDDDDSGLVRYVSLRYGGFNLSPANEINGLTLGAVGRETSISFIEVFQNQDDGIEYFGGTVNINFAVIANVGDDSIDYDEGFRGKGQFFFIQQGIAGANTSDKGGEWDGGGSPNGSQPYGIPAFYNITAVGLSQKAGVTETNSGLHIRDNAGARVYNSAFLDFGGATVIVEGDPTDADTPGARAVTPMTSGICNNPFTDPPTFCNTDADCGGAAGSCETFFDPLDSTFQLELEDNTFYCFGNGSAMPDDAATATAVGGDGTDHYGDADGYNIFTIAGLDNNYIDCAGNLPIRDLQRIPGGATSPDPVVFVDPVPAAGSPLLSTDRLAPADGFFKPAPYRGAFGTVNWASGWSTMSRLGYIPSAGESIPVVADVTASTTWFSGNTYTLTDVIYVTNGATLTIEPGTIIRGENEDAPGTNNPGTLVITRGSKIDAQGTVAAPIVFTDLNDDNIGDSQGTPPYDTVQNSIGLSGQWGGLIMLGRTYVARGTAGGPDATVENQIEGLVNDPRGLYGDCLGNGLLASQCDDDDSGVLRYVSLRYGGFNLSPANEINGLTLGAVGRTTDIDFVEVFQNQDDGVEFFGGTVGTKNMITANVGDDSIDYDEGYRGLNQFWFIMQGIAGANTSDKGGEWDGGGSPNGSQPYGIPYFHNVTAVGLSQKAGVTETNSALHIRDNAGARVYNSAFVDFGGATVIVEGDPTDVDTPGARAVTPMTSGICNNPFTDPPTFCNTDADCGGAAGSCETFFDALDSTFQLELEDNFFYCFGNGSAMPDDSATATAVGGDGTDHYGDADGYNIFTIAGLDNTYSDCVDPLPITELTRTTGGATSPDPVIKIDPRPSAGSALLNTNRSAPNNGFFDQVSYKGAFDANNNWAAEWSTMDRLGYFAEDKVEVSTDISTSTTWTKGTTYVLTDVIYVTNGATLTIEPGTVVRSENEDAPGTNNPGTVVVTRGAKINAVGTPEHPIVFTDLNDDNIGGEPGTPPYDIAANSIGLSGQWGGVILLGRTYVARGTASGPDATVENQIEGLVNDPRGLYGDCVGNGLLANECDDDDSGVMRYVSIRYGGFNLSPANEINGLTLGAVGRGTELSYIEVFQNQDDGVEFFGGTVNTKYMITANVGDDSIDYDEGYRGLNQYWFIQQGIAGANTSDKGGEWDGGGSPNGSQPYGIPAFYNITAVGLSQKVGVTETNSGLHIRDNAGARVYNSAFLDFGGATVIVEGDPTDADTPGARAVTPMTSGICNNPFTDPPTFCNTDADCGGAAGSCETFFLPLDSTFQLELEDNAFYCFGNGSAMPDDAATATAVGGDGTDHYGDADGYNIFTIAGLDNTYDDCAQPLPISALTRLPGGAASPDPVVSIDPRPAAGSNLISSNRAAPNNGFFDPVAFKGAFPEGSNWARKWSAMDALGYFPECNGSNGVAPEEVPLLGVGVGLCPAGSTNNLCAICEWHPNQPICAQIAVAKSFIAWKSAGDGVVYDTLRTRGFTSAAANDFANGLCLEGNDGSNKLAVDKDIPAVGEVFFYLVRSENDCSEGTLGRDSAGATRAGNTCL